MTAARADHRLRHAGTLRDVPEDSPDPFAAVASVEGVTSAYVSARDGIDAVLRDRGMRRSSPEDTTQSLLLGARASARLDDLEETGPVRLYAELLGLLPVWNQAPLQALARIHTLAAAGTAPTERLGRPASPEGAERLHALARAYAAPTAAPGLVVAALVHAAISDAAAFGQYTGVVARAAERLVLVAKGVDPASLIIPEEGHAAMPEDYRRGLEAYGRGDAAGIAQWLLYASAAYGRAAEASPLAGPR